MDYTWCVIVVSRGAQRSAIVLSVLFTHDGAFTRRLDVCCVAHVRIVPRVVCGIG